MRIATDCAANPQPVDEIMDALQNDAHVFASHRIILCAASAMTAALLQSEKALQ